MDGLLGGVDLTGKLRHPRKLLMNKELARSARPGVEAGRMMRPGRVIDGGRRHPLESGESFISMTGIVDTAFGVATCGAVVEEMP